MNSDVELVRRVQEGTICDFETLVLRYERVARVVAFRILKDHHISEDVVQDAFVIAYRRLESLRNGTKFGPWLTNITRRQAIRELRKRRRHLPLDVDKEVSDVPGNTDMNRRAALVELVGSLPVHERLAVSLHYLNGYSVKEIAKATGRSVGTITKQLSRAIARLRRNEAKQESLQ